MADQPVVNNLQLTVLYNTDILLYVNCSRYFRMVHIRRSRNHASVRVYAQRAEEDVDATAAFADLFHDLFVERTPAGKHVYRYPIEDSARVGAFTLQGADAVKYLCRTKNLKAIAGSGCADGIFVIAGRMKAAASGSVEVMSVEEYLVSPATGQFLYPFVGIPPVVPGFPPHPSVFFQVNSSSKREAALTQAESVVYQPRVAQHFIKQAKTMGKASKPGFRAVEKAFLERKEDAVKVAGFKNAGAYAFMDLMPRMRRSTSGTGQGPPYDPSVVTAAFDAANKKGIWDAASAAGLTAWFANSKRSSGSATGTKPPLFATASAIKP